MDEQNRNNPTGLIVLDPVKQEVRDHWNKASDGYNRGGFGPAEIRDCWKRELSELIGDGKKKVLDVGTGTGFVATAFAEMGHDATGVDLSPVMLANARKNADKLKVEVRFQEADAEKMPFEDSTFDLVISRHVFWTLPNPGKAIDEWIRVAKPGGKVAIIAGPHSDRRKLTDLFRRLYLARRTGNLTALTNAYSMRLYRSIPYASKGITAGEMGVLLDGYQVSDVRIKGLEHITELSRKYDPAQRQSWWCIKHIYYPGFLASFTVQEKERRPWDK